IALFTAQWSLLLGAAIAFLIALALFGILDGPIRKSELFDISRRQQLISQLAATENWQEALMQSSRSVATVVRYHPDRVGSVDRELSTLLAGLRIGHGLLQGATGMFSEAERTVRLAAQVFEREATADPDANHLATVCAATNQILVDPSLAPQQKMSLCREIFGEWSPA
ncbi:MAG: hypothetical protein ACTHX2_10195, partial [Microbacterium sp.]